MRLLAAAQLKMDVGPAGDALEREADEVSRRVVAALASRVADPADVAPLPVERPVPERPFRQAEVGAEGGPLAADTERALATARGGGTPLPGAVRQSMEGAFGTDFTGVKIHADANADHLNQRLQSQAFTVGRDIFFSRGAPDLASRSGQGLLAHELTHTIQQGVVSPRRDPGPQRYFTASNGVQISDDDSFSIVNPKVLFATGAAMARANEALAGVGALVQLAQRGTPSASGRFPVKPVINVAGVTDRLKKDKKFQRLPGRQDPSAPYRTFADCFRTSTTISGLHPGNALRQGDEPPAVMKLPTLGPVPIVDRQNGRKFGATDPGARASVSFFMAAFPVFRTHITGQKGAEELVDKLGSYLRASDAVKFSLGQVVYKAILASTFGRLFVTTFGINESMAPAIGTALVNVGDAEEAIAEKEKGGEKWNMHWAGIVMAGGTDYVTLENFATNFDEIAEADLLANADILSGTWTPSGPVGVDWKSRTWEKDDLMNDRWIFRIWGKERPFHTGAGEDPHATETTLSLPVSRP